MLEANLKAESSEIIKWLKNDFTMADGLPFASLDGLNGFVDDKRHILNDLGDYLPFVSYYGDNGFCRTQLNVLSNFLDDGVLKPRDQILGIIPVTRAFEHTDLLLGLIDYYYQTKTEEAFKMIDNISRGVLKKFYRNKLILSRYLYRINSPLPVFNSIDGMFIELYTELNNLFPDRGYIEIAEELFNSITQIPFFQKTLLFPESYTVGFKGKLIKYFPSLKKSELIVNTMKDNTNMIYAFHELYRVNKNPEIRTIIDKWAQSFFNTMVTKEGGVIEKVWLNGNKFEVLKGVSLTSSFPVLDLLCDLTWTFKDASLLSKAKKIADYWIELQSHTTGLFPLEPDKNHSYLDSETDMIIALMKLSEITNERIYRESAERAFQGIIEHHKLKKGKGYSLSVDINSGKVVDYKVKVKFVSLLLKPFILFESRDKIYENSELFNLLKDR